MIPSPLSFVKLNFSRYEKHPIPQFASKFYPGCTEKVPGKKRSQLCCHDSEGFVLNELRRVQEGIFGIRGLANFASLLIP